MAATTLNIAPEELHDLLIAASFYLGGNNDRAKSAGQRREVVNIKGHFDELAEQIEQQLETERRHT